MRSVPNQRKIFYRRHSLSDDRGQMAEKKDGGKGWNAEVLMPKAEKKDGEKGKR